MAILDGETRGGGQRCPVWLWVLLGLALIACGLFSWVLAEKLTFERAARLIEREQDVATSTAMTVGGSIGRTLAHMRSVPRVLAQDVEVLAALRRMGPDVQPSGLPREAFRRQLEGDPELARLGKRLASVLRDLDIDQVLVMNAAGDCIVSGGFTSDASPNGVNYLDRKYFRMAWQEGMGRQFAVGRTSNTPGIFYSAAVVDENRFLGVVVVKVEVSRLARVIENRDVLVADEYGVVIVAGDAAHYMKTLPGARVGELTEVVREGRYKRQSFVPLEIRTMVEDGMTMARVEGRPAPVLQASSDALSDLLKVWVLREVPELPRLRAEGRWIFLLLFLASASLLACVFAVWTHLRRTERHRAEIAGINAELVKLNQELQIQARFDALTGCANRRHFFEELAIELKRTRRFEAPCSLAMLDIDHFKAINDRDGHAAGDALLQHFARTVRSCLRATDMLGRIGGEEFALLMPQTPFDGGLALAERIRQAVEESSITYAGRALRCTVSVGVVVWCGEGDGESPEALIARSDDALYAAKHGGRNRVCAGADPG